MFVTEATTVGELITQLKKLDPEETWRPGWNSIIVQDDDQEVHIQNGVNPEDELPF